MDRIPIMKTSDFYLKPTAKNINESMEKRFGEKLDLESYSIDQLNRAANLIENKISEHKRGDFNSTLNNEDYHRLTFMKDAVTTELNERAVSKAQQKAAGAALAAKRGKGKAKGASKEMEKMNTKELEKFAGTKHKGLPEKKKKVDESMQTMKELALHHATEYAKHHKKGSLEHAMHHKKQCEECGGVLTHDAVGECWMSHGGDKPARVMLSPISGNAGAGGAGGVASMMTAEATKKKAKPDFLDFDKDGNKKEPMKKALKDKKMGEAIVDPKDLEGEYQSTITKKQKASQALVPAKNKAHKKQMYAQGRYPIQSKLRRDEQTLDEIGDTPKGRATLGSYINKAVANKGMNDRYSAGKPNGNKESDKVASQRASGIKMAVKRLTRESTKAKPDFLDMDKDGNKKETMKKAVADKKKKSVKESYEMAIRRYLREGEEGKAELVMAVKDMVDKFTAWSEDIASMQATAAMEMADQIRDELGSDQSEAFKQAISPALDTAFQAVKGAREAMNNQVAAMTGGAPAMPAGPDMGAEAPAPDMGAEPDMGPEPDMGDEGDIAADMPPPEGREKRESIERHRRLARILAS